jgi:tetratricopeptide (TPR) repeat protein
MPLELSDQKYLRAAHGYVELGMHSEAAAELGKIDPFCLVLPEVLSVRLEVYAGLQEWEMMQMAAKRLRNHDPTNVQWVIALGYATRRAESIGAAKSILMEALKRNPEEPTIRYNLACYECQLGDLAVAKQHLKAATKADTKFRGMALDDPDLEPLWAEIARLEG